MDGNGLELYPVVSFCISDVELLGSAITLLVSLKEHYKLSLPTLQSHT